MDLRVVKTKKAIREAFLQIRKTTPLEKLKVRDICTKALINKSTFYNHYEDVFALSREIEDEVLAECLSFENVDCLFSDPEKFLQSLPVSFEKQKPMIDILYSGRQDVLYATQMKQLHDCFRISEQSAYNEILLTFLVGGTLYTMQEFSTDKKYSIEELNRTIASFIHTLSDKPD